MLFGVLSIAISPRDFLAHNLDDSQGSLLLRKLKGD
jgi:hypothetical protein